MQAHTRLLTRAKEWEKEGKDSSFVLRGKDLTEAEQWVAKGAEKEPQPTALQSQYILASRQAATKLQRIIIGAVAVAFLIAVGLAIYAFWKADMARARELVFASSASQNSGAPDFCADRCAGCGRHVAVGLTPALPEAEQQLLRSILAPHVHVDLAQSQRPCE